MSSQDASQALKLPVSIDQLLQKVDGLYADQPPVLLAGSWVEGRAYQGADVDLFAFLGQDTEGTQYPVVTNTQVGGQAIDVEAWSQVVVERIIARYEGVSLDPSPAVLPPFVFKEFRLLHVLRVGDPLRDLPYIAFLKDRLDRSAFLPVEVLRRFRDWRKSRKAIRGLLTRGYFLPAVHELGLAVYGVTDAYLIAHGETNPRGHWLFQRFDKLGPEAEGFRRRSLSYRFPTVDPDHLAPLAEVVESGVEFITTTYRDLFVQLGLGESAST